ncbi:MAG: hypothetical protein M3Y49_08080 [Actinomycetota bacterium]|nr:hypothetical protein [Actinomycetota bacterium]
MASPPRPDRLRLTIKALGHGSRLLQSIEVGTWVVAEGPDGAMTAARRTRRNVLLIAGGVGITPMRTLFETIETRSGEDLVLLYRARDPQTTVFRDELDALTTQRQARVIYLLGSNPDLLSARSLGYLVPDTAQRDVYLCGLPGLAATVRSSLTELGLPSGHLHEERFSF